MKTILISCVLLVASVALALLFTRRRSSDSLEIARRNEESSAIARVTPMHPDEELISEYGLSTVHRLPPFASTPAPQTKIAPRITLLRVVSSSSFVVLRDEKEERVTIAGVKAPGACNESLASFNGEAERFLKSLLETNEIRIQESKPASSGHIEAVVRIHSNQRYENVTEVSGRYVNLTLIQNGYGCADDGTLPHACPGSFQRAEQFARQHHRGMWRTSPALAIGFVSEAENALNDLRSDHSW